MTMLAMKRGEVALLELARWTKGWRASRARVCVWSMAGGGEYVGSVSADEVIIDAGVVLVCIVCKHRIYSIINCWTLQ